MADYVIGVRTEGNVDSVIERVKAALAKEGFGVLSEIRVHEKLREKLGVEMKPYVILGACHPPSAYRAITEEESIGVLLPCNVLVHETEDGVAVKAVKPSASLAVTGRADLAELAIEVEAGLRRALERL